MNSFDAVVIAGLVVAMVLGFRSGLLRSAVTIIAYLIAMPVAVWINSLMTPAQVGGGTTSAMAQNSLLFFGIFVITGIVMGSVLRMMIDDAIGSEVGFADRLFGAALGAVRILLIAVTMVLIFDQMVPANAQPAYLADSGLRPLLSALGQKGFKTLPPEATAYIDQLKRGSRR
jgi:membrane protein required for colicin V production